MRNYLQIGAVEVLLLSEDLRAKRATYQCPSCNYKMDLTIKREEPRECPKCNDQMKIVDSKDLIDDLVEIAETVGSEVEIISTETEEGIQLLKAFGGMGAILRYRP